jgi:hypothetical protein
VFNLSSLLTRVVPAEAWEHFGNPKEGERPLLGPELED